MRTKWKWRLFRLGALFVSVPLNAQTMVPCSGTVTLGDSGARIADRTLTNNLLTLSQPVSIVGLGLNVIDKLSGPLDTSTRDKNTLYQLIIPRYNGDSDVASEKCGAAALNLRSTLSDITNLYGGPGGDSLFFWLASTNNDYVVHHRDEALKPVSEAMRAYDSACLQSEGEQSQIAKSVGYLVLGNGIYICSAYRTGPDTVLTARHCIYQSTNNMVQSFLKKNTVSFGYLPDKSHVYQVCAEVRTPVKAGETSFPEKDDYIELKLSGSPGPYSPLPKLGRPVKDGEKLKLFGLFPDLQLVTDPGDVGMRSTKVLGCTVKTHASTCIVHACESEAGTSGAPLFVVNETGALSFAGLHVGSYPLDNACPAPTPPNGAYNEGIVSSSF